MFSTRLSQIAAIAASMMLVPQPAYAYIDPGIGSLLFQGIVAAFVTVAAGWAWFKMKISIFFGRTRTNADCDENAPR